MTSLTDPDGVITGYEYDARNRMSVVHTESGDVNYGYCADGLLSTCRTPTARRPTTPTTTPTG